MRYGILATLASARLHGHRMRDYEKALAEARTVIEHAGRKSSRLLAVLGSALAANGQSRVASAVVREALNVPGAPKCFELLLAVLGGSEGTLAGASSIPSDAEVIDAIRMDCGGESFTSDDGVEWQADRFFHGGKPRSAPYLQLEGTDRPDLYRAARVFRAGMHFSGYRVPVVPGTYRVTVHCAESSFLAALPRCFDVVVEERKVVTDLDPMAAGYAVPIEHTFEVVVDDGTLDLHLDATRYLPLVAGIEIVPAAES